MIDWWMIVAGLVGWVVSSYLGHAWLRRKGYTLGTWAAGDAAQVSNYQELLRNEHALAGLSVNPRFLLGLVAGPVLLIAAMVLPRTGRQHMEDVPLHRNQHG